MGAEAWQKDNRSGVVQMIKFGSGGGNLLKLDKIFFMFFLTNFFFYFNLYID